MAYSPPSAVELETAPTNEDADPDHPPADTVVRLIASIGTSARPQILAIETSSTGETATVERNSGARHRLDMSTILTGGRIERDGYWYELYTPSRYAALLDGDRRPTDLPEPTHKPA